MSLVYDEETPRIGMTFNFASADATKKYAEHYSNWKVLEFIANNALSTFAEKTQARKEMLIAERKMEFWRRHENFSQARATLLSQQILREWSTK